MRFGISLALASVLTALAMPAIAQDKPAELAPPSTLLRLSLEHDRMFTY